MTRRRLAMHRRVWPHYREGAEKPPAWASAVRSWCVVREAVDVGSLEGFDLVVVLEPQQALAGWLGPAKLERLRAQGIRFVAHVPLVRPPARSAPVPPLGSLARTGVRAEAWYVEAAARIRASQALSWDGCYLDDLAQVVAKPQGREAAVELISLARAAGRGGIVIVQSINEDVVTQAADLVGAEAPLA